MLSQARQALGKVTGARKSQSNRNVRKPPYIAELLAAPDHGGRLQHQELPSHSVLHSPRKTEPKMKRKRLAGSIRRMCTSSCWGREPCEVAQLRARWKGGTVASTELAETIYQ